MGSILNLIMSDNDFQTAQIQQSLQDLNKEIGSINTSIRTLSEGFKDNSRRLHERAKEMQISIDKINDQVDDLNLKVRYWKFGLCFILACGSILVSIVAFSNEFLILMKNIFGGQK